ncbi:MAG: hypothetical protein KF841_16990 [Phycisphaerae bacterium]|nr:hypothetical protein [Phycisphaerae bacterium]
MQGAGQDLANRRIAWENLATLFLDTDFTEEQLAQIAHSLRTTGYSIADMEHILEVELAPLLYVNRCSPAGEWSGFDTPWIENAVQNGRHREIHKWYRWLDRLRFRRALQSVKEEYWHLVASYLSRS